MDIRNFAILPVSAPAARDAAMGAPGGDDDGGKTARSRRSAASADDDDENEKKTSALARFMCAPCIMASDNPLVGCCLLTPFLCPPFYLIGKFVS